MTKDEFLSIILMQDNIEACGNFTIGFPCNKSIRIFKADIQKQTLTDKFKTTKITSKESFNKFLESINYDKIRN